MQKKRYTTRIPKEAVVGSVPSRLGLTRRVTRGERVKKSAYFTPTYRENVPGIYALGNVFLRARQYMSQHTLTTTQRWRRSNQSAKEENKKRQKQLRCTKRLTLGETISNKPQYSQKLYITYRVVLHRHLPLTKEASTKHSSGSRNLTYHATASQVVTNTARPRPSHPIPIPARAKQAPSRVTGKSRRHD